MMMAKKRGGVREGGKKEFRCVIYIYQFPTMDVTIMCGKYVLIKIFEKAL